MVNFNLSLTSVNAQSLSILQAIGSIHPNSIPSVIGKEQSIKDFREMVNTIITGSSDMQAQPEIAEIASAINSNPELKAAVYSATAVINVLGQSSEIAFKQPFEIKNNPIVNNLMQENKLTPAEQEVFIKAIKAAAIEVTVRQGNTKPSFVMDSLIPKGVDGNQSMGAVRFMPEISTQSDTGIRIQPAAEQVTSAAYNAVKPSFTAEKIIKAAEILKNTVNDAVTLADTVNYNYSAINEKKAELVNNVKEVFDLINKAADEMLKVSEKNVFDDKTDATVAIERAADAMNGLLMSYLVFVSQIVKNWSNNSEKGEISYNKYLFDKVFENNKVISLTSGNSENYSNSGKLPNYEIVMSQNNKFNDVIAKIVNLLNEMNGNMEISRTYTFDTQLAESIYARLILSGKSTAMKGEADFGYQSAELANLNSGVNDNKILFVKNASVNDADLTVKANYNKGNFADFVPVNETVVSSEKAGYKPVYDLKAMIENKLIEDIDTVKSMLLPVTVKSEAELQSAVISQAVFAHAAEFAVKAKHAIVIKQVIEAVVAGAVTSKVTSIKVNLRPDNLGPITINLESKDGILTAHLLVNNADVRDALRANASELKDSLNRAGINVSDFTIGLMNNNSGNTHYNAENHNKYFEWEGGVINVLRESAENTAGYTESGNGYLNFFA